MDFHYWKHSIPLLFNDKKTEIILTLKGYSQAARCTGFYVKELDLLLDCGNPHGYSPKVICITHGHLDHVDQISKSLLNASKTNNPLILCPQQIKKNIIGKINNDYALTKHSEKPKINKYDIKGVISDTKIPIKYSKKNKTKVLWFTEIIKCYHSVPCVGYGFIQIKEKLKPEYKNLSREELEKIKDTENLSLEIECPTFCYLCDTNEKILSNTNIKKYKTIIIECTYINNDHLQLAKKNRHMHYSKLKPFIIENPDINFILIHFSARYSYDYIKNFFEKENIKNIIPFNFNIRDNKVIIDEIYHNYISNMNIDNIDNIDNTDDIDNIDNTDDIDNVDNFDNNSKDKKKTRKKKNKKNHKSKTKIRRSKTRKSRSSEIGVFYRGRFYHKGKYRKLKTNNNNMDLFDYELYKSYNKKKNTDTNCQDMNIFDYKLYEIYNQNIDIDNYYEINVENYNNCENCYELYKFIN
mgnify:CR=1 FL=1